jgi:cobyric acid synthase
MVEGAGSPAEINLRAGDIANMGFARAADVPVVLVGDIDRGGVIASLVGTRAVIDPADAAMIHGFLINKFRGDPALFADGYRAIEARTGWKGLGIVPWLSAAVEGYEMHMGKTRGPGTAAPFAVLEGGRADGAIDSAGAVMGSYLHGLFASSDLRRALLDRIGLAASGRDHGAEVDAALDAIAAELSRQVDLDVLLDLARSRERTAP